MAVIIGILALLSLTLFGVTSTARSEVIHAAETGRGEYERGVFTPGKPEFRYRFDVDEKTGKAKMTELIRLRNNEIIQLAVDYVIIATEDGTDLSSLLTSPTRRKQKILTLVGKPGFLATEIILLGEDFFEYCKATSGRFYLATGTVRRAVSVEEDTSRQFQQR